MNIDMAIFHQAFFDEAADLIAEFEREVLALDDAAESAAATRLPQGTTRAAGNAVEADPEQLNTIFRCAHSIKGGAATFGFTELAAFTHRLESLLDEVRNRRVTVDRRLVQILLDAVDRLNLLLSAARGEGDPPDTSDLALRIDAATRTDQRFRLRFKPGPSVLKSGNDPARILAAFAERGEVESIRCDLSGLPELVEMEPEAAYLGWEVVLRSTCSADELAGVFEFVVDDSEIALGVEESPIVTAQAELEQNSITASASTQARNIVSNDRDHGVDRSSSVSGSNIETGSAKDSQTLRVSIDKVDKLVNLVGELAITQAMLNDVVDGFSMDKLPRLQEAVEQMARASRELQERVMAVRMRPIKYAFGRFPRLVRDLAAASGKHVELRMTGEETELDKAVIEAIADPLTHLVRNSIDHGLEAPVERAACGKQPTGVITLSSYQEGGEIVVNVSDDGKGLDRDKILRRAIERGIASADATLTDEQIYEMIFEPGFSTADQVTDVSGRGVGMDIVKSAVEGLAGSLSIQTVPGSGATFRIRLPLTMAILEGLSVSVGDEVYIIPLTSIVENIRPTAADTRAVAGGAEFVLVRGEAFGLVRLFDVFGTAPKVTRPEDGLVVIVESEGRRVALLVDNLIAQSQVVIKNIETNYRRVEGIAGATILGDGSLALIIDVASLVRFTRHKTNMTASRAAVVA